MIATLRKQLHFMRFFAMFTTIIPIQRQRMHVIVYVLKNIIDKDIRTHTSTHDVY